MKRTAENEGGRANGVQNILDPLWRHENPIEEARRLIDVAIRLYRPRAVYGLYSSGNDSACSTALTSEHGAFTGAATIDTTIGIAEAQEHGRAVAKANGWPLTTLIPPITYEEFCERFGMPGPGAHALVYSWLKERCVRNLVRPHVRKNRRRKRDRVLLITGVRSSESDRRMGHVEPIYRVGSQIWLAPLINWTAETCLNFRLDKKIPSNSGEANLGNQRRMPCVYGERPTKRLALCQQCERKGIEEAA